MPRKAIKRKKGRSKAASPRSPKLSVKAIAEPILEALRPWAESVNEGLEQIRDKVLQTPAPVNQVHPKEERFFTVGCDQRHTKNMGNYESLVFGISLSGPVVARDGDAVENPETQTYLKGKYESMFNFIKGMMVEIEHEVDANLGGARV